MAPDKIYARVTAGNLYASRTPKRLFGEEYPEYIRKDAILDILENAKHLADAACKIDSL